jgi:hypothetical protein
VKNSLWKSLWIYEWVKWPGWSETKLNFKLYATRDVTDPVQLSRYDSDRRSSTAGTDEISLVFKRPERLSEHTFQSPTQQKPWGLPRSAKRSGRETYHPTPSTPRLRDVWRLFPPLPLRTSMVHCLNKHRDESSATFNKCGTAGNMFDSMPVQYMYSFVLKWPTEA